MPEFKAMLIAKIKGSQISDDGKHMLLHIADANDTPSVLAVPTESLSPLIEMAALCQTQAEIKASEAGNTNVFPVTWWEFGYSNDGQPIMSFTLSTEGKLTFLLRRGMPEQMLEILHNSMHGASLPTDQPVN